MDSFFENILTASPAVLVNFSAEWCEPCKWAVPVLEDVETHFNGKIKFHKIDIDEHAELSGSLHILSVPTLILFNDGKEVWRMRGFDSPSALIKTLSGYIK